MDTTIVANTWEEDFDYSLASIILSSDNIKPNTEEGNIKT